MREEIERLPSGRAQAALAEPLKVAEAEAGRGEDAAFDRIKASLEMVKTAGDAIDGGEKIVTLCTRAIGILAPMLKGLLS